MRINTFNNLYWQYNKQIQAVVNRLLAGKDHWVLHIKRQPTGVWSFSLPRYGVIKEAVGNFSTTEVIDYHASKLLGRDPVPGDRLSLTISTKEIKWCTTTLQWTDACPNWPTANIFVDRKASEEQGKAVKLWLCPLLQQLFNGKIPEKLWVDIEPPHWRRDQLRFLVLPYESSRHPLYHDKVAIEREHQEELELISSPHSFH